MHPADDVSTKLLTKQLVESREAVLHPHGAQQDAGAVRRPRGRSPDRPGIVHGDGKDVTIVACGVMVSRSLEAAETSSRGRD